MTETQRVPFDEQYRELSYEWLQDPELARLTMSRPQTRAEQLTWFEQLESRTDYAIWGIEHSGRPVGVMGLKHLDSHDGGAEYFMYLGDTSVWGRGIASWATAQIVAEARSRGCTYVYGLIGTHNERSRAVHEHLGFVVEPERDGIWRVVYPL